MLCSFVALPALIFATTNARADPFPPGTVSNTYDFTGSFFLLGSMSNPDTFDGLITLSYNFDGIPYTPPPPDVPCESMLCKELGYMQVDFLHVFVGGTTYNFSSPAILLADGYPPGQNPTTFNTVLFDSSGDQFGFFFDAPTFDTQSPSLCDVLNLGCGHADPFDGNFNFVSSFGTANSVEYVDDSTLTLVSGSVATPEPSTLDLLGTGVLGIFGLVARGYRGRRLPQQQAC